MTKDEAFAKLAKSKFRSRFKLAADDLAYIERVGLETIRRHAEDFVREKLGPAELRNDGKQIPMRGHPNELCAWTSGHGQSGLLWGSVSNHRYQSAALGRLVCLYLS